jgi:hypothetical protein
MSQERVPRTHAGILQALDAVRPLLPQKRETESNACSI